MEAGEITSRTFRDYYKSCESLLKHFGPEAIVENLRPDDLMAYRRKLAENRNATSLGNEVGRGRLRGVPAIPSRRNSGSCW
jgi:hypothetical protein